eukprot:gb/GECG01014791.1/.p1 GENE.gb/GECG01014791.1/~~gb/GECG01014791.1/.p1  ORF type:complete len:194 (+),score=33.55 gb/GECG01014791.1/:1-582(+)
MASSSENAADEERHGLLSSSSASARDGGGWMERMKNVVLPAAAAAGDNADEPNGTQTAANRSGLEQNETLQEIKKEMTSPAMGSTEDHTLNSTSLQQKPLWMFASGFILLFTLFYGLGGFIYGIIITGMVLTYRICSRRHPGPASQENGAAAPSTNGSGYGHSSSSRSGGGRGGGVRNVRGINDLPQTKPKGG